MRFRGPAINHHVVFVADALCVQIPPEDTASTRSSFTVQDLRPFTEYVFRVRCVKEDGRGYWSDWSEEASGTTYEDRECTRGPGRRSGCGLATRTDLGGS